MENFNIYNPVNLIFGKAAIKNTSKIILDYGSKVLLIYGKESIKKNGVYNELISQLHEKKIDYVEYSGIKSNPIIEDVRSAISLAKTNNVDVILAVGGGSVIDTAKLASVCIKENIDPWDFMKGKAKPIDSIPLIVVLTLSATGTEMNPYSVVQNNATSEKIGMGHNLMYPKCSILDPEVTFSVSEKYSAYGLVDIIAHCLEAFFANGSSPLSDKFICSIINEVFECSEIVLAEPTNYEYRARVMLASTCALNGITAYGKQSSGDWGVHEFSHTLSVLYDIPHGASLSIVYLAWFKLLKIRNDNRLKELGLLLFNTDNYEEIIENFISYFKSIDSPISLSELKLQNNYSEIINIVKNKRITGYNYSYQDSEYESIVKFML